jgi:hypothetical protein
MWADTDTDFSVTWLLLLSDFIEKCNAPNDWSKPNTKFHENVFRSSIVDICQKTEARRRYLFGSLNRH